MSGTLVFISSFLETKENFMSTKNIKSYNTLTEKLEKLAGGTKIHASDESFPTSLNEQAIRQLKSNIKGFRGLYDVAQNNARIKHDEYSIKLEEANEKYTRFTTMLYGLYGKENQTLADFGLSPYKVTGKKGTRTATASPNI